MIAPTHSIFGIALTLIILALFGVKLSLHWTILLFAIIGSILPDIDYPTSLIGKILHPISSRLERKFGHRTITHSFTGWAVATAAFALLLLIGIWSLGFISSFGFLASKLATRWLAAFSISYLSHLILDMLNKRGSQLFWPDRSRDVIPKNQRFRIKSGSRSEIFVFIAVLALMFLALPISKYGPASTIRWLLATSGSAIAEFKALDTVSYLDFKGQFNETKQPVEGKAEILDVKSKRLVILLDNDIYTISDELSADILAEKMRVDRTDKPLKVERKEFKNETREYLLSQIPEGARASGVIELPKGMTITIPNSAGFFKVFEQKGDYLYLNYANREQIEELGLTKQFDLQKEKDQVELSSLHARAKKVKAQIKGIEGTNGLTELGQEVLLGTAEIEKRETRLEELQSQLADVNLKIKEVKLRIESRKLLFSGSVYIRE